LYIILGDGAATPYYTTIFCYNLGLSNYDALTEVGTDIVMMASNAEVVRFNPQASVNSLTGIPTGSVDKLEIGFPIGDKFLANFNPATAHVTWHIGSSVDKALYVSDFATGWYRWAFNQAPENTPAWSPFAVITNGAGCVQSVETTPGVHQLLVATAPGINGKILKRDITVFADNGAAYTWFASIGDIVLAQPGQLADVDFITVDANATGGPALLGLLFDEISGAFQAYPNYVPDTPYLPQSMSVITQRFYADQNPSPSICRYMQVQLSGPATATKDEILSYSIYGAVDNER
jgi:hypothetical protein